MDSSDIRYRHYPTAKDDVHNAGLSVPSPQTESSAYRLAFLDSDFMVKDDLRPVRLQLELLKPELVQRELGIERTVVIFGGTRIVEEPDARARLEQAEQSLAQNPSDQEAHRKAVTARSIFEKRRYYDEARKLGMLVSKNGALYDGGKLVVVTGGGPGIMEAANRGADDAGAKSIGLNIILPMEQRPNPYISPELCFQFHYFAIRKMHFLLRAQALVAFPGGYGTLDELFETLTLIQTGKIRRLPVLLFGEKFWRRIVNFEALAEEGVIAPEDLLLFHYVETAEEAWKQIASSLDLFSREVKKPRSR